MINSHVGSYCSSFSSYLLYALVLSSYLLFYFADSIENLPKLVEDIVQTSINTGPRGALRMVQGIQAVVGVGGEWLADISKVIIAN